MKLVCLNKIYFIKLSGTRGITGVTGRHGEAWPPQLSSCASPDILSGHANSVLQKQAFIIYTNNVTTLAEETVRHIKIVATSCQILRLKCTNFDFGWGSTPDPAGGPNSAPPDLLAGFKGPTSKGRGGRDREGHSQTTLSDNHPDYYVFSFFFSCSFFIKF